MKITSTAPCRISLFGGGTDVDPYSSKYGGMVFNMAINIRQHVTLNTETAIGNLIDGDSQEFIKAFANYYGVTHSFDGPIESGLGSSASLAVALIGGVNRRECVEMSREEIAEKAWDIEVNKLGLYGGKQDQYCSAFGGVNLMEFGNRVKVNQYPRNFIEPMLPGMVLFYTGTNRKSGKIQEGFKELSQQQIDALDEMKKICMEGVEAIGKKDVEKVGRLLDCTWEMKKKSNGGVTNEKIDLIYKTGRYCGAWGGKIMGAGGGGHILFICDPFKQIQLKEEMAKLGCTWVDFSIDYTGLDVRIM